jgi:predicted SprT family Zn-dependent metalloprotease
MLTKNTNQIQFLSKLKKIVDVFSDVKDKLSSLLIKAKMPLLFIGAMTVFALALNNKAHEEYANYILHKTETVQNIKGVVPSLDTLNYASFSPKITDVNNSLKKQLLENSSFNDVAFKNMVDKAVSQFNQLYGVNYNYHLKEESSDILSTTILDKDITINYNKQELAVYNDEQIQFLIFHELSHILLLEEQKANNFAMTSFKEIMFDFLTTEYFKPNEAVSLMNNIYGVNNFLDQQNIEITADNLSLFMLKHFNYSINLENIKNVFVLLEDYSPFSKATSHPLNADRMNNIGHYNVFENTTNKQFKAHNTISCEKSVIYNDNFALLKSSLTDSTHKFSSKVSFKDHEDITNTYLTFLQNKIEEKQALINSFKQDSFSDWERKYVFHLPFDVQALIKEKGADWYVLSQEKLVGLMKTQQQSITSLLNNKQPHFSLDKNKLSNTTISNDVEQKQKMTN